MKRKFILLSVTTLLSFNILLAQVGIGTTTPNASSKLDISSTNSGILIPRMTTTQRNTIASPALGLLVFDNTTHSFWFYNGSAWNELSTGSATNYWSLLGSNIYNNNGGNVGIGTTNPVSKLTISTPNNTDGFTHISDGGIILKEAVGGISAAFGTSSPHTLRLIANGAAVINLDPTGNVGVGLTDPAFKMDISDRIRLRSGTYPAGLWLNDPANTATIGFLGVSDVDRMGLYGNNSSWGLLMNTNTGDVAVGNIPAVAGYKLTVNGGAYLYGALKTNSIETSGDALVDGSLTVSGSYSKFFGHEYLFKDTGPYGELNNQTNNCSIVANQTVAGYWFVTFSDERIKNIIGKSNSAKDLETINALQVTDYTMKDKATYGNRQFKKIVAQVVEKVYPQVITKRVDFIPNVYQVTDKIEKTGRGYLLHFANKHNIDSGAKKLRIQVVNGKAMKEFEIASIPSNNEVEIIAGDLGADNVFVYGEQVNDFRSVDYEGLTTLNISATQELSNLIKKQQSVIETQQQQIDLLEKRLSTLENKL